MSRQLLMSKLISLALLSVHGSVPDIFESYAIRERINVDIPCGNVLEILLLGTNRVLSTVLLLTEGRLPLTRLCSLAPPTDRTKRLCMLSLEMDPLMSVL